jgi:Fur family peroxide stress response transcriptional regulator
MVRCDTEMTVTEDQLFSILRDGGYKVTPQRLAICNYVLSSKEHPTVEQIHFEILKKHPTISLNTIYQTMDMLKDLNLIHELSLEDNASRFDPNTSIHVNIICQKCNMIRDFESEEVKKLWSKIVGEIDVNPIGHRLDVYVVCDDCKK